jgi:Ribosomal protein L7/L12 C-terminal domain
MIKIDLSVREALTMISNGCSLDMFEKIVVALESTIDAKEKYHVTITGGMTMKNRISCIKAVRQHTGWGLKEAKDWTDGMIGHWDVYGVWQKGDLNQISVRLKTKEAAENLLRDLKNVGCEGYLS